MLYGIGKMENKAVPEMALPFLFWYRLRIAGWNVE
jgi:hypothetical protein